MARYLASPKRLRGLLKFDTIHEPQKHSAVAINGDVLISAQPTEIDLVQKLHNAGINLSRYNCTTEGDEKHLVNHWSYP